MPVYRFTVDVHLPKSEEGEQRALSPQRLTEIQEEIETAAKVSLTKAEKRDLRANVRRTPEQHHVHFGADGCQACYRHYADGIQEPLSPDQ